MSIGRYFALLNSFDCSLASVWLSLKYLTLSIFISGWILTIRIEFLCIHTEIGKRTILVASVKSNIAIP